jgi:preprotein translocase subunit SecG
MADAFFAVVLSLLAIFLILLVLVQRGRGGGLAGALGGMGGSSAFGAKAGDVFTRITIITASIWIVVCLAAVFWAKYSGDAFSATSATMPPPASAPQNLPPAGQSGSSAPGSTTVPATTEVPPSAEDPSSTNGAGDTAESAAAAPAASQATPPAENE